MLLSGVFAVGWSGVYADLTGGRMECIQILLFSTEKIATSSVICRFGLKTKFIYRFEVIVNIFHL